MMEALYEDDMLEAGVRIDDIVMQALLITLMIFVTIETGAVILALGIAVLVWQFVRDCRNTIGMIEKLTDDGWHLHLVIA